jgi:hypothetical protein
MSNIYFNEFDRLMKHELKPLAYLRYGDDWLCFAKTEVEAGQIRELSKSFLNNELSLTLNPKIDHIRSAHSGVSYLGVDIWSHGRRLQPAVRDRIEKNFNAHNAASYKALVASHEKSTR